MKITVYTITDCKFSNDEKAYLNSHNLSFEEKNLETNREFLTEMLAVGNNFAGTPVTKIEKDNGQIVVLKGFTKEEFDENLGFNAAAEASTAPAVQPITAAPPAPAIDPLSAQAAPAPVEPVPAPAEAPVAPVQAEQPQLVVPPAPEPIAPAPEPAAPPAPTAPTADNFPPLTFDDQQPAVTPTPVDAPPAPAETALPPIPPAMPEAPVQANNQPMNTQWPSNGPVNQNDPLHSIMNNLQARANGFPTDSTGTPVTDQK